MKTKMISEADYIALAEREESHFFDHKAIAISGKTVQKIATAFANADGGDFIIGVADVAERLFVAQRWQGSVPNPLIRIFKRLMKLNRLYNQIICFSPAKEKQAKYCKSQLKRVLMFIGPLQEMSICARELNLSNKTTIK